MTDVGNGDNPVHFQNNKISSIIHNVKHSDGVRDKIEPSSHNCQQESYEELHNKNDEGLPKRNQEEQLDAVKFMIEAICSNNTEIQSSNQQSQDKLFKRRESDKRLHKETDDSPTHNQNEQLDPAKLMIDAISSNSLVIQSTNQHSHDNQTDNMSPVKNQAGLSTNRHGEQLDAAKLMIDAISSNIGAVVQPSNQQRRESSHKAAEINQLISERKNIAYHPSVGHENRGKQDVKDSHSVQNNNYNLNDQQHRHEDQERKEHRLHLPINVANQPQHVDENRYEYSRQLHPKENLNDQNDYEHADRHQIQYHNGHYHGGNHFAHTQESYHHEGHYQNRNSFQQEGNTQNVYHLEAHHQLQKQHSNFPLTQQQYESLNQQHYSLSTEGHRFQPQHISHQDGYISNGYQDIRYTQQQPQQPHMQHFPQQQDQFGTVGSHYLPHSKRITCNPSSQNSALLDHEKRPLDRNSVSLSQPGHVYQDESRSWL